ncbi:MAG: restriction endonuclease subunit S [Proteobacteria bacterium]|nr:restriction endonuclease subunit S [Pseudomonadota bacterium]
MKVELNKIASVQMGYSFRARLYSMNSGAVAVIQMKDLTDQNRVNCSALVRVDMDKPKEHHLVKSGDLIFRSRGLSTTSAILLDDPGIALVSAPLLRIRVSVNIILPEYLNWFINQPPAQAFLASRAKGTSQKMISKEEIEKLEIFVPPIERQKAIVEMASLAEKEQQLMKMLGEKRYKYISTHLIRLAQGA